MITSYDEAKARPADVARMAQAEDILVLTHARPGERVNLSSRIRRAGNRTGNRVSILKTRDGNLTIRRSLR